MKISNVGNSVVFDNGTTQTAFPKGCVILTSSKKSTSINVKLLGSRKTILSFPAKEIGYDNAEDAINYLSGLI